GSTLLYSSYIGGSGDTQAFAITVDASGHAAITGSTTAANLPMVAAIQDVGGGGVVLSFDGGKTWTVGNRGLASSNINTVILDPRNTNVTYAATDNGVWKSTDGGGHWSLASSGLPPGPVAALAIDRTNTSRLIAGVNT